MRPNLPDEAGHTGLVSRARAPFSFQLKPLSGPTPGLSASSSSGPVCTRLLLQRTWPPSAASRAALAFTATLVAARPSLRTNLLVLST
jgi:hypothetical protein